MEDKTFSQDEPNVVNEHKDTTSNSSLTLPEILSLPSTTSVTGQKPTLRFPTNFPKKLDDRYRELHGINTPLQLNWNTFVALPPLFGQHLDSIRLHNWALNRLQYRQDIHEDIQEHKIQILTHHYPHQI